MDDKRTELLRYENRAKSTLEENHFNSSSAACVGSYSVPSYYRSPYLYYEECIKKHVKNQDNVLEICAGTGLHTSALIQTGAKVIASDLSSSSLEIIKKRFGDKVVTAVADMEALPFPDTSFDVVAGAGGLSYGEPALVDVDIRRVLKKGGSFICVDSPKS